MTKVLIVDDEAKLGPVLAQLLESQGYEVERAAGGRDAVERLRVARFDIVVTDLRMSEVDGLAVLREARRSAPSTEVLMMTGFTSVEAAIAAMREGAADYVIKPFAMDEFRMRMQRLAERCELRARAQELRPEALLQPGFSLDQLERDVIHHALARAQGNKTEAARLLGITRRRLYSRLKSIQAG